ncbi:Chondroitin proteoglycan 3, partial [Meloidogyne graminicola]
IIFPSSLANSKLIGSKNRPTCDIYFPCTSNEICNGGICVGLNLGKCTCGCAHRRRCMRDDHCGFLIGACQNNKCDCDKAFQLVGYSSRFDAYKKFCNKKACTVQNETEACFGMSCSSGYCRC